MKILITGVSGFVGQSLVETLKMLDVDLVGVGRNLITSNTDTFFSVPDFSNQAAWKVPLEACDVVIHLAARVHIMNDKALNPIKEFRKVNVEGTLALAVQAARAGVKRFIYVSSIGVNGSQSTLPFTELSKPNPHNAYAYSKWEAEQTLHQVSAETDMEFVIIRPPLVYGAGAKGNFARLLKAVEREIPMPLGGIYNKRSFVYIGNLIDLIVRCIEHPVAANQLFLVSDGQDLSTTELLQKCAVALGVKSRLIAVPQSVIKVCASILGKQSVAQGVCGNLQVDISKAYNLLGWKPPFTVADGLKDCGSAVKANS